MEGELLDLFQSLEAARAMMKKAKEALVKETQAAPKKNKKLIEEYKELCGFQLGLQRSGQATYEYIYQVAMA